MTPRNPEEGLPAAAAPGLRALSLVHPLPLVRRSARWLLLAGLGAGLLLLLAPWQQTSQGIGQVLAFAPVEREQLIEAPIGGRVIKWFVPEGSRVARGQRLAEVADNDPQILPRLVRERDAGRARAQAKEVAVQAYRSQIEALRRALQLARASAQARVRMAEQQIKAAEQSVAAAQAALHTARLNEQRQQALEGRGLTAVRSVELAVLDATKAQTEVFSVQAKLEAARGEALARRADLAGTDAEYDVKIAKVEAAAQTAQAELEKARAELTKVEVRLSRQAQMIVVAPRAGTIVRVLARQGGDFVKVGDPLARFVPATAASAVELWVDGNDVPLIQRGRAVRLQFEGWPAVQFSGWPSVAVGTFGARVAFVDAAADANGRFRVVVRPDARGWPGSRFLRQGARAHGWILLNRVSLGYELWRRLNGFPPIGTPPPAGTPGAPTASKGA